MFCPGCSVPFTGMTSSGSAWWDTAALTSKFSRHDDEKLARRLEKLEAERQRLQRLTLKAVGQSLREVVDQRLACVLGNTRGTQAA